ncbi:hypothetical protein, partial [Akkermansia sp.]|uniref:hypothetical protein n=3 Tax=Akkermansia TaxID=239934 RepID=UPI001DEA8945
MIRQKSHHQHQTIQTPTVPPISSENPSPACSLKSFPVNRIAAPAPGNNIKNVDNKIMDKDFGVRQARGNASSTSSF